MLPHLCISPPQWPGGEVGPGLGPPPPLALVLAGIHIPWPQGECACARVITLRMLSAITLRMLSAGALTL